MVNGGPLSKKKLHFHNTYYLKKTFTSRSQENSLLCWNHKKSHLISQGEKKRKMRLPQKCIKIQLFKEMACKWDCRCLPMSCSMSNSYLYKLCKDISDFLRQFYLLVLPAGIKRVNCSYDSSCLFQWIHGTLPRPLQNLVACVFLFSSLFSCTLWNTMENAGSPQLFSIRFLAEVVHTLTYWHNGCGGRKRDRERVSDWLGEIASRGVDCSNL